MFQNSEKVGGFIVSSVLNSKSMTILEKSLDAVWLRQQVISNNIANAATPGFKSQRLEFEELLEKQIKKAGQDEFDVQKAIDQVEPRLVSDENTAAQEDGNNVDLDYENIEMARAQMQYNYLTSSLNSQINRLKYVITEGRG
jgi:flagellar basal-body rod protein FlgB